MRTLVTVFVFLGYKAFSQATAGIIETYIPTDSIKINHSDNRLTLDIVFTNFSDSNLVLYGLRNVMTAGLNEQVLYNRELVSAGIAVFVYNSKHERIYANIPISKEVHDKPMTKELLSEVMKTEREKFLDGTKCINGRGKFLHSIEISLKGMKIGKGNYCLQIVYYSGRGLINSLVGQHQIDLDQRSCNGELFLGYAKTNEIVVSVF